MHFQLEMHLSHLHGQHDTPYTGEEMLKVVEKEPESEEESEEEEDSEEEESGGNKCLTAQVLCVIEAGWEGRRRWKR